MRIYLDNCCLQRPLDDQTHPRVRVETEALFVVLVAVQAGHLNLLGSEALDYELGRIPDPVRRADVQAVLALSKEHLAVTDEVELLAQDFEQLGVRALDALHLALASFYKADFFVTCDDPLFRKAQALPSLVCKVTTLLGFVPEVST
jgi:predicted nucleic acid-binding protein